MSNFLKIFDKFSMFVFNDDFEFLSEIVNSNFWLFGIFKENEKRSPSSLISVPVSKSNFTMSRIFVFIKLAPLSAKNFSPAHSLLEPVLQD